MACGRRRELPLAKAVPQSWLGRRGHDTEASTVRVKHQTRASIQYVCSSQRRRNGDILSSGGACHVKGPRSYSDKSEHKGKKTKGRRTPRTSGQKGTPTLETSYQRSIEISSLRGAGKKREAIFTLSATEGQVYTQVTRRPSRKPKRKTMRRQENLGGSAIAHKGAKKST